MSIRQERLVDAFSDCVGREKAESLIQSVAQDAGYDGTTAYDEDEAIEIAVQVANRDETTPFIRTAANTLQTRIRTGNV